MIFKDGQQFFTVEKISPHLEKTSEGYLLCRDVPISKVGVFEYTELESGIKGKNGRVQMKRTADELFKPETIQSFNAKPVVIGHARFADPDNWKDITIGVVQNVRQGEGDQADLLLADLLITDRKGIELVESGELREVSCGYDAQSVEDGIGEGHQEGIVGNHVALVSKARCDGCKVRDGAMTVSIKTLLRRLFRDGDEEKFDEMLDKVEVTEKEEVKDEEIVPPVNPESSDEDRLAVLEHEYQELAQKFQAIYDKVMAEESEGEEEEAEVEEEEEVEVKDEDEAEEAEAEKVEAEEEEEIVDDEEAQRILADAETVCQGMKRPQGDGVGGKFTRNQIERIIRTALKDGGVTAFGDASTLEGKALEIALTASAMQARSKHNPIAKSNFKDGFDNRSAQINEINRKYWSK